MFQIYIDDKEVITSRNFSIKEEFLNTSSVILNDTYPAEWENSKDYVNNFYVPKDYTKASIFRNNELYFSGIVKNSGNLPLNPRHPKMASIQILDYKTLLSEGKNLDFVIKDKTIKEAIQMVVDSVSDYGFVVGNLEINSNDIIGAYSTLDQSPFDVLQYLSEISNSLWTTRVIDEFTNAIDFYDIEALVEDDTIEYNENFFEENQIVDISYSFNTNDYRNKQEITSENVFAGNSTIENVYANGYDNTYITSQKIGIINSIEVNGEEKIVATEKEKELGIYAEYYYNSNSNSFYKNEDLKIDNIGTKILINYIAIVRGREIVINTSESQRIKKSLGRNGTITRYEERNDLLIESQLNKVGQTYLKFKGKPDITLKIQTANKDILTCGHKVNFDIRVKELDFLNTEYLVKNKTTDIIQTGDYINIFYTYELSSNFNAESTINFFDNQRRKSKGNIESDNFIDRNIDIENVINIVFKKATIEEVDFSVDNTLQSRLQVTLNS